MIWCCLFYDTGFLVHLFSAVKVIVALTRSAIKL